MTPTRGELWNHVGVGVPVAVTGLSVLGVSLQDWTYIVAIAVGVCQLARYAWLGGSAWRKRNAVKPAITVPPPK